MRTSNDLPLTARQQEVVRYLGNFTSAHGFPPTRAEIAHFFGFASPNAAEDHLRALERKGVLTLQRGTARSIVLTGYIPKTRAERHGAAA